MSEHVDAAQLHSSGQCEAKKLDRVDSQPRQCISNWEDEKNKPHIQHEDACQVHEQVNMNMQTIIHVYEIAKRAVESTNQATPGHAITTGQATNTIPSNFQSIVTPEGTILDEQLVAQLIEENRRTRLENDKLKKDLQTIYQLLVPIAKSQRQNDSTVCTLQSLQATTVLSSHILRSSSFPSSSSNTVPRSVLMRHQLPTFDSTCLRTFWLNRSKHYPYSRAFFTRRQQMRAHTQKVRSVSVHETYGLILTASEDCTLQLWNTDKIVGITNTVTTSTILSTTTTPSSSTSPSSPSAYLTSTSRTPSLPDPVYTIWSHEYPITYASFIPTYILHCLFPPHHPYGTPTLAILSADIEGYVAITLVTTHISATGSHSDNCTANRRDLAFPITQLTPHSSSFSSHRLLSIKLPGAVWGATLSISSPRSIDNNASISSPVIDDNGKGDTDTNNTYPARDDSSGSQSCYLTCICSNGSVYIYSLFTPSSPVNIIPTTTSTSTFTPSSPRPPLSLSTTISHQVTLADGDVPSTITNARPFLPLYTAYYPTTTPMPSSSPPSTSSHSPITSLYPHDSLTSHTLSSLNAYVCVGTRLGKVSLIHLNTGVIVASVNLNECLKVKTDQSPHATASPDCASTPSNLVITSIQPHPAFPFAFLVSTSSKRVALVHYYNTLCSTQNPISTHLSFFIAHAEAVSSVAVAPAAYFPPTSTSSTTTSNIRSPSTHCSPHTLLASCSVDNTIRIWSIPTTSIPLESIPSSQRRTIDTPLNKDNLDGYHSESSHGNSTLHSIVPPATLNSPDLSQASLVSSIEQLSTHKLMNSEAITSIAFSPTRPFLISGGADAMVCLYA